MQFISFFIDLNKILNNRLNNVINLIIQFQDHLQQKRFIAQNQNNTTYVYDFPEVFRQALYGVWQACGKADTINPADIVYSTELVLNSDKELVQQTRLPGENLVRTKYTTLAIKCSQ